MKTIDKIITKVNGQYGAPMGRGNVIPPELQAIDANRVPNKIFLNGKSQRVFDCYVPFVGGAYDRGGAYWGSPANLRVKYTKDLAYIEFYRTS